MSLWYLQWVAEKDGKQTFLQLPPPSSWHSFLSLDFCNKWIPVTAHLHPNHASYLGTSHCEHLHKLLQNLPLMYVYSKKLMQSLQHGSNTNFTYTHTSTNWDSTGQNKITFNTTELRALFYVCLWPFSYLGVFVLLAQIFFIFWKARNFWHFYHFFYPKVGQVLKLEQLLEIFKFTYTHSWIKITPQLTAYSRNICSGNRNNYSVYSP